jgi:outer membrane protein OmpA-like peptidoglycan-associated protein
LAFGSLAIVLALTGCAGRSWQFWKTSSTEAPPAPGQPTSPAPVAAAEEPAPAAPATAEVPTARPAPAAAEADATGGFSALAALGDIRFRPGLVTVGKADVRALDAVVRWLKAHPGAQVRIEGHTDDLGTPTENLEIGQRRAASVMRYLIAKGVEQDRITIVSFGADRPLCVEKTDACRALNRRARFLVKQP